MLQNNISKKAIPLSVDFNFVTSKIKKNGKTHYTVQRPSGSVSVVVGKKNLMKWMTQNREKK